MDIKMPVMDGLMCTSKIHTLFPEVKVIILTMYDDERYILHLLESGANGYLLKNAEPEEVEQSIMSVFKNGYYFNDHISKVMHKGLLNKSRPILGEIEKLTDREREILQLICLEYTAQEIAQKLFLSVRTIEGHKKNLLRKTDTKNTAGLVVFALTNGIVDVKG